MMRPSSAFVPFTGSLCASLLPVTVFAAPTPTADPTAGDEPHQGALVRVVEAFGESLDGRDRLFDPRSRVGDVRVQVWLPGDATLDPRRLMVRVSERGSALGRCFGNAWGDSPWSIVVPAVSAHANAFGAREFDVRAFVVAEAANAPSRDCESSWRSSTERSPKLSVVFSRVERAPDDAPLRVTAIDNKTLRPGEPAVADAVLTVTGSAQLNDRLPTGFRYLLASNGQGDSWDIFPVEWREGHWIARRIFLGETAHERQVQLVAVHSERELLGPFVSGGVLRRSGVRASDTVAVVIRAASGECRLSRLKAQLDGKREVELGASEQVLPRLEALTGVSGSAHGCAGLSLWFVMSGARRNLVRLHGPITASETWRFQSASLGDPVQLQGDRIELSVIASRVVRTAGFDRRVNAFYHAHTWSSHVLRLERPLERAEPIGLDVDTSGEDGQSAGSWPGLVGNVNAPPGSAPLIFAAVSACGGACVKLLPGTVNSSGNWEVSDSELLSNASARVFASLAPVAATALPTGDLQEFAVGVSERVWVGPDPPPADAAELARAGTAGAAGWLKYLLGLAALLALALIGPRLFRRAQGPVAPAFGTKAAAPRVSPAPSQGTLQRSSPLLVILRHLALLLVRAADALQPTLEDLVQKRAGRVLVTKRQLLGATIMVLILYCAVAHLLPLHEKVVSLLLPLGATPSRHIAFLLLALSAVSMTLVEYSFALWPSARTRGWLRRLVVGVGAFAVTTLLVATALSLPVMQALAYSKVYVDHSPAVYLTFAALALLFSIVEGCSFVLASHYGLPLLLFIILGSVAVLLRTTAALLRMAWDAAGGQVGPALPPTSPDSEPEPKSSLNAPAGIGNPPPITASPAVVQAVPLVPHENGTTTFEGHSRTPEPGVHDSTSETELGGDEFPAQRSRRTVADRDKTQGEPHESRT